MSDLDYALWLVARAEGSVALDRPAGQEAAAWRQRCDSLPDEVLIRFIRKIEVDAGPDTHIIRDSQVAAARTLLDRSSGRPSVRT
jgi:hypothetical protein